MKDLGTQQILMWCDSTDDLYLVTTQTLQAFVSLDTFIWHLCLDHLLYTKSKVILKCAFFLSIVQYQFKTDIQAFQCDNDGEFTNKQFYHLCDQNGIYMLPLKKWKIRTYVMYDQQCCSYSSFAFSFSSLLLGWGTSYGSSSNK